jgi:protease I
MSFRRFALAIALGLSMLFAGCGRATPVSTPTPTREPTHKILLAFGDRFIDDIYTTVRPALEGAGYKVIVASSVLIPRHGKETELEVQPDLLLTDVYVGDYDAIVFTCDNDIATGGGRPETDRIAQQAVEQGKVLAAICNGPLVLGYARVVKGVKVTSHPATTCGRLQTTFGAVCTNAAVERDGLIITARDRYASQAFAEAVLEALQDR